MLIAEGVHFISPLRLCPFNQAETKISMAQPKVKGEIKDSVLSEESVVSKVAELMETLDHVKKYNALARSFKKFALIVIGSIAVFLALGASLGFLNLVVALDRPQIFLASILLLLVPITGITAGVILH